MEIQINMILPQSFLIPLLATFFVVKRSGGFQNSSDVVYPVEVKTESSYWKHNPKSLGFIFVHISS